MATRLVILADRILGPLRSCDTTRYRLSAEVAAIAETRFRLPPIVLVNFRREALLDFFPDCLFLNAPERLSSRVPATYAHCLRYTASEDDVFFLEADALLTPEAVESSHFTCSGVYYTESAVAPGEHLVNYYIRANDRPHFERTLREAGSRLDAMKAQLLAELPVLGKPKVEVTRNCPQRLMGAAVYDHQ